jgi:hypothetical protein
MNDMVVSLIVIAVTAVFVVGLFVFLNQRKQREMAALSALAGARGWQLETVQERLAAGYRIRGVTDGMPWTFESMILSQDTPAGPGSSNTHAEIHWHTNAVGLAQGVAAVGPQMTSTEMPAALGGFQQMLLDKVLGLAFGEEAGLLAGLKPVPYGSQEFQRLYMCWAHEADSIPRLLDGMGESGLLAWRGNRRLLIRLTAKGLDVSLPEAGGLQPEEVERLVAVGSALARSWQSKPAWD